MCVVVRFVRALQVLYRVNGSYVQLVGLSTIDPSSDASSGGGAAAPAKIGGGTSAAIEGTGCASGSYDAEDGVVTASGCAVDTYVLLVTAQRYPGKAAVVFSGAVAWLPPLPSRMLPSRMPSRLAHAACAPSQCRGCPSHGCSAVLR